MTALAVNIVASGVAVRPVDGLPSVHDADLKAHVTGRSATVTIGSGAGRHAVGPQAQHLRLHVRSAGHASEASAIAGQAQDRWTGAGGRRNPGVRSSQRRLGDAGRSQHQQGDVLRPHQHGHAGQGRTDQGEHHLQRDGRSQRILRRQTGDEPEARSQYAEGHRQQSGLPGQGRRQDQRPGGEPRLSQTRRRRRRRQAAGNPRRRGPRAARARSRTGGIGRDPDQAHRQDGRPRQQDGHRGRSHPAQARQHPARLGQGPR